MKLKYMTLATLIVCLGSLANATDYGHWKKIHTSSNQGFTAEGVEMVLQNHPGLFDETVEYTQVNVDVTLYKYTGPTKCKADDSRLYHTNQSYGGCEKPGGPNQSGACFQVAQYMPPIDDPCL